MTVDEAKELISDYPDDAAASLVKLQGQVTEALQLLRELEWKDAGTAGKVCVVCDAWYQHEPGCRLAKLLQEL